MMGKFLHGFIKPSYKRGSGSKISNANRLRNDITSLEKHERGASNSSLSDEEMDKTSKPNALCKGLN